MSQSQPAVHPLPFDASGMLLDRSRALTAQVHEQLKARIHQGQLAAAAQLPTTRALAQALGVSRNTVVRAYEQLQAEGYIEGRTGAGSFVASIQPRPPVSEPPGKHWAQPDTALWSRLQALPHSPRLHGPERAFRHGIPAVDQFPFALWSRLQARFWRRNGAHSLGYADPAGDPRLRSLIAAYLSTSRGVPCSPEQVLITAGAQQAIALCAMALLRPQDRVAVEAPGYRAAALALSLSGNPVLGVPVDGQGLQVQALQSLRSCRMVYVTPSHQFPKGVAMSLQRRLDLLAWAQANDAFVLEDDYDGEYRYSGAPLSPLAALDKAARVLYIGTFSKLMFPALRLGYLVAPKSWVPLLAHLRGSLDRHGPTADQAVMADFMTEGHFLQHVRRVRRTSRVRRDALFEAWQQHFGERLPLPDVQAGLHACLPLNHLAQEQSLARLASEHGIELARLSVAGANTALPPVPGLLLGFACVTPAAISAAVKTLKRCWAADMPEPI